MAIKPEDVTEEQQKQMSAVMAKIFARLWDSSELGNLSRDQFKDVMEHINAVVVETLVEEMKK
jgi:hypothetical protein